MVPSILEAEIREQPAVLSRLLGSQQDVVDQVSRAINELQPRYMLLAARGSSDNAARYGQYLFGALNNLSVALATPSLFTKYKSPPDLTDTVVLAISQSGMSEDILTVVTEAQRQHALTIAVTNHAKSPLADECDFVIDLRAGEERSIAASKTYTASLVALAMLSCSLSRDAENKSALSNLPEVIEACTQEADICFSIAEGFREIRSTLVIGRGFNYATAFELALKLNELAYVIAVPYSTADFLHGPVALVDGGMPIITIGARGKLLSESQQFMQNMLGREAKVIAISNHAGFLENAMFPLPLVPALPEWLSPVSLIVPGQLFALGLTLAKGLDPDNPRGLNKVTITH